MASSSEEVKGKRRREEDYDPLVRPLSSKYPPIQFDWPEQTQRYNLLRNRKVMPSRFLDQNCLSHLSITEEVTDLLEGVGWSGLLHLHAHTFRKLTLEFLASFTSSDEAWTFQIAGKKHAFNVADIARIFGWDLGGAVEPPEKFETECWRTLTGQPNAAFKGRNAKASKLRSLAFIYIHRVLTYTLFGRGESNGNVQRGELVVLYFMDKGIKTGFTHILAEKFKAEQKKETGAIVCGGLVTLIAGGLNLYQSDSNILKPVVGWSTTLDADTFVHMKFLEKKGDHYCCTERFERFGKEHEARASASGEAESTSVPSGPSTPGGGVDREYLDMHFAAAALRHDAIIQSLGTLTRQFTELRQHVDERFDAFEQRMRTMSTKITRFDTDMCELQNGAKVIHKAQSELQNEI